MQFNDPVYKVKDKLASAEQFLKAYQGSFPRVFPDNMQFQDFMEFAEDYADYVCSYEKSFKRCVLDLRDKVSRYLPLIRAHKINDKNHTCGWCTLAKLYERNLKRAEEKLLEHNA